MSRPFRSIASPALPKAEQLPLVDADVRVYPPLAITDRDALLNRLIIETPWRQEYINMFGRRHKQPRLEAWYGDPGTDYSYSGVHHTPLPWTDDLQKLRDLAQMASQSLFNSVLLNYYRDGQDHMGLHADDEPELGERPTIASLSLGAQRRMFFRPKKPTPNQVTYSLDLDCGSLLIMAGDTQRNWKHGIRKTRKPCGARVNLTFRNITRRHTSR